MIEANKISTIDPEIKLIEDKNIKISTIVDGHLLSENGLLLLKNKKSLRKFLSILPDEEIKELSIVLDKSLLEAFNESKEELSTKIKNYNLYVTEKFDLSICVLSKYFYMQERSTWNDQVDGRKMGTADIHPSVVISPNAFIGKNVTIGKDSIIHDGVRILSNSTIGEEVELYPNVVIYQNVIVGSGTRIHSNSVIGGDGFGYNFVDGVHHKIYHFGGVVLGKNVEIGPISSVDSGTFSPTILGDQVKLDNLVQIGHNVHMGAGVIMCSQSGVAGSSKVGDFTVVGGKVGITDHIEVGKACQIAGAAMVTGNLDDKAVVAGHPARPLREWMKGVAYIRKESLKK